MRIFRNGRFKVKSLVSTSENIDEIGVSTVKLKFGNRRTINGFLLTSEDIYLLEDNKRIENINNTHTEEKGKKVIEKKERNVNNVLSEKGTGNISVFFILQRIFLDSL